MTTTLSEGVASELGQRIRPTFGYYRQRNGWITISPTTQLERVHYIARGWTYLEKYGTFDMSPYVANHPFESLFMFGGVEEMPAQQVLETGLYIDPPMIPRCMQHMTQYHRGHTAACWRGAEPVHFPQMATLDPKTVGPFACEFCQRKLPTEPARRQHQSVAHAKELGNLQTGQSMGKSLAEVLNAKAAQPSDSMAELRETVARLERRLSEMSRPEKAIRKRRTAKVSP